MLAVRKKAITMSEQSRTEKPNVTLPGRVEKIIEPNLPTEPEKVQIAIDGADPLYREIRIENSLTDGKGDEVQLQENDEVDVTIEADKDPSGPPTFTSDELADA
jgi:hypothetical protein